MTTPVEPTRPTPVDPTEQEPEPPEPQTALPPGGPPGKQTTSTLPPALGASRGATGAPLPLNDDRPGLGGTISGSVPLAGPKLQETTEVAALLAEAQAALVRGDMQRATDLFKAAADAAQARTPPAGRPAPGGGDPTTRE
ncbi:MAG: hypothetical protein GX442_20910 [Candidatus Riflebacteria bacterium]|nr:hypothetical protein [Candidatus Riflebacteria bacterium]